jgi:hypothetical protein
MKPNLVRIPGNIFSEIAGRHSPANNQLAAKSGIAGELTFAASRFESDPVLDVAPSPDDPEELKADKFIHSGGQYWRLLGLLKGHRNRNKRWVPSVLWLKQAGICEPWDQILPALLRVTNCLLRAVDGKGLDRDGGDI